MDVVEPRVAIIQGHQHHVGILRISGDNTGLNFFKRSQVACFFSLNIGLIDVPVLVAPLVLGVKHVLAVFLPEI